MGKGVKGGEGIRPGKKYLKELLVLQSKFGKKCL